MSMSEAWPSGPARPAASGPLRTTILGGLAYSALDLRERLAGDCAGCGAEPCPGCAEAADLAGQFEHAYMQVANGSTAWCDLAVTLISEMN